MAPVSTPSTPQRSVSTQRSAVLRSSPKLPPDVSVSPPASVLIGDAFGFLDPLYSSGVLLALKSGELAADAVVEGFEKGDTSEAQLGRWGEDFNRGVDRMRRLVCEYYDGFHFGHFVRAYPHLRNTITDLLIGDLFTDRVDVVWEPMESQYPPGRAPIPAWNAGAPAETIQDKEPELVLPAGPTR
ncbi:MAG: tryptophan 7-halogenase [Acidobacteria bacterium]|nr:tryptophan 7-halogenase [Acidobacteriota bacterium]MBA3888564.1 tryptophan 7-halogenase [Acidobacteriota bacterium]